jgi:hypothetical protein
LANLDLRLVDNLGQVVAQSASTADSLEHLHVPVPTSGHPGDYKLQVIHSGGGLLATDFALAWWTSPLALVPGDYNLDGLVDALDYNVWRASFGTSTAAAPLIYGDGNNDGTVDAADYTLWRKHVGQSWSAGATIAASPVPEGSTFVLSLLAIVGCNNMWRGKRSTKRASHQPDAQQDCVTAVSDLS